MSGSDIEIEIDGKKILTQANKMVIQVADESGIYIPRFCYHKQLSIAANCRMCLVEVEKSAKPLPACATPVAPGMKVLTRSPKALAAQRAVMEFLLINHPLDCPICDQGGECELQDLSLGYGSADSYYFEGKRAVKDEDLGPLIATEMTRCIHCTRCVRFGDEIAGMRELGLTGRGEHTEVGTYIGAYMHSEVSGNIIDLCPVGALTSKPFRFKARAWELQQYPTIAPHDCLGSHLYAHTRNGKVMRIVPREHAPINQMWLSDRDRFSYDGLYHADRLTKPWIRKKGVLQETDWQTALEMAAAGLKKTIAQHGPDQIAALASPHSTVEEFYLLQKLFRSLGSSNLDHRLRQTDFNDQDYLPAFPGLDLSLDELENCDVIVLVGSNIQKEQPLAALRIRKAFLKGARIISVNMMDYVFPFELAAKNIVAPNHFVPALSTIVESLEKTTGGDEIAKYLRAGKKVCVLVGALGQNHAQASEVRELSRQIAHLSQASFGLLTEGANAAGAWLAGMIPHRGAAHAEISQGMSIHDIFKNPVKAYLFLNLDLQLDTTYPREWKSFEQSDFVISLSSFKDPISVEVADVILPVATFTETSGTFVNVTGEWQSFKGVASPYEDSRPAWKVLRVLGNLLDCPEFNYENSETIRDELQHLISAAKPLSNKPYPMPAHKKQAAHKKKLSRIGEIPTYATDSLVRHSKPLQAAQHITDGAFDKVHLHPNTASLFKLKETEWVKVKQGEYWSKLSVVLDARVPEEAAWIAGGVEATRSLPELFGEVEIEKWKA